MAKNINRKVFIYINGREVENTLQSIRNEVVKLEREQRKLPIGSEEYLKKGKEIAELKGVLEQQKVDAEELGNSWEKSTQKLAEYSNILMGIQSAFQMIDLGIGKIKDLAKDAAALDDAYGQVQKTTGLTHEQVEQLNDLFKKMDTRTSREQLNQLAYEAGKLGIQGVKDVAAFVDASDKINVALGDVLGEGAMVTVGKMAGVYAGSTKELADATGDLNKQMLAIGSAVNELGKLSTANEHYLVDFAGRLGGIAVQAGLSADQILGFASALDQDMQKVEMSATAFQKFIGQIMKKPEEFAKQAGMAVSDFSQLVRTDLNEALFRVLEGFSGKGGYAELVNIFKDLGLDGASGRLRVSKNKFCHIGKSSYFCNEKIKAMVEVHDINGKLLYIDKEHSETCDLWADGVDLQGANFRGWDLSDAYFSDCNLDGAIFEESNLNEATLSCCSVESAVFRRANLSDADLWGTDIDGADTEDAIIPYRHIAYYR